MKGDRQIEKTNRDRGMYLLFKGLNGMAEANTTTLHGHSYGIQI